MEDQRLRQVADALGELQAAAALCDPEWRLQWASEELKKLLEEHDDEKLGYGLHIVEAYLQEPWSRAVSDKAKSNFLLCDFPRIAYDTNEGVQVIADLVKKKFGQDEADLTFEPEEPPPIWISEFDFVQGDLPPLRVKSIHIRLHDRDGSHFGNAIVYDHSLPASITTLILRGDVGMFERMVRLYKPGRRAAAILLADLQSSTLLSRKLSSATYFNLVRSMTTNIDEVVVKHTGIVGKHAGDGVTAFFLADDLGSSSRAAKAAISAAVEMEHACSRAVRKVTEEVGSDEVLDFQINVGLHWGPTLYMGQLVTGGRLEVTALGDEVNEAARIQQSAINGEVLASKLLLEQLEEADATELDIDPDTIRYRLLQEMDGVTEKAMKDAGALPVAVIPPRRD